VVLSKSELPGADGVRREVAAAIGREVIGISAVTGQGLDELLRAVVAALDGKASGPASTGMGGAS
jgi:predicted GTPase